MLIQDIVFFGRGNIEQELFLPENILMSAVKKEQAVENIRDHIADAIRSILGLLVEHPQSISVEYVIGESTTIFHVETDQRNIGQVLGSRGKHIDCLRTLVSSIAGKHNIRAIIEIPYFPK